MWGFYDQLTQAGDDVKTADDTIVALATPRGSGAIAIVRLSGERAIPVASCVTKHPDRVLGQEPHRLCRVDISGEKGDILDYALCAVYHKPRSYTGENVVEFYLHGSPYIVAMTIDLCCKNGARVAQPGEFTLRAYLNGRMDLTQAEAVADLVASTGHWSHRAAVLQREGALSSRIRKIRDVLMDISSLDGKYTGLDVLNYAAIHSFTIRKLDSSTKIYRQRPLKTHLLQDLYPGGEEPKITVKRAGDLLDKAIEKASPGIEGMEHMPHFTYSAWVGANTQKKGLAPHQKSSLFILHFSLFVLFSCARLNKMLDTISLFRY